MGTHPECDPGSRTLVAKCTFSSRWALKVCNCLKIHPIALFSLLTVLGLVYPLGFLKEEGGLLLVTTGHVKCQWNVGGMSP